MELGIRKIVGYHVNLRYEVRDQGYLKIGWYRAFAPLYQVPFIFLGGKIWM